MTSRGTSGFTLWRRNLKYSPNLRSFKRKSKENSIERFSACAQTMGVSTPPRNSATIYVSIRFISSWYVQTHHNKIGSQKERINTSGRSAESCYMPKCVRAFLGWLHEDRNTRDQLVTTIKVGIHVTLPESTKVKVHCKSLLIFRLWLLYFCTWSLVQ